MGKKLLLVIDMQNDFVSGSLGSKDAEAIVPRVIEKIKSFSGEIFYTRDTHFGNYLDTQEGKLLPIRHCIKGTYGHELVDSVKELVNGRPVNDKTTFGSPRIAETFAQINDTQGFIESVTLIGLCTDICVISNALILKAFLPDAEIHVDSSCCAGTSREAHLRALEAMRACQIFIE